MFKKRTVFSSVSMRVFLILSALDFKFTSINNMF